MITIAGLSKNYGSKRALIDVDLIVERGSVCGIMGDNGAGKTTLFRCIAGLESYSGSIVLESGTLGFLPAEPFFFAMLTGREYIQLMCNARGVPVGDIDQRNVFELPLDSYASTYSTGMKKKLALTAVLLQQNDIFVLDEPWSGVDLLGNIMIVEIVRRLQAMGKTLLVSSHVFSLLSQVCDKICVLSDGRLVQTVERAEFDMFEAQLKRQTLGLKFDKLWQAELSR